MIEVTGEILQKRREELERRCPITLVTRELYHGSPVEGMREIWECGELHPPEHNELDLLLFSTSTNSNMLRFFGDGNGFLFQVEEMPCLVIDPFFHALLAAQSTCDFWWDHIKDHPEDEDLAEALGFGVGRGNYEIRGADFKALLPGHIEGICLPGWENHANTYNREAEVAVNRKGCKRLWKSLQAIYFQNYEYEPAEGWSLVLEETKELLAA